MRDASTAGWKDCCFPCLKGRSVAFDCYERFISKDGPDHSSSRIDGASAGRGMLPARAEVAVPSTTIACPLTNSESSLARNSAIAAISSGRPARGHGWKAANSCVAVCSPPGMRLYVSGVAISPGQMQLTRILSLASSIDAERVRLITPAFAAQYACKPGAPRSPAIEAVEMMEPPPDLRISGTACLMPRKTARSRIEKLRSQFSALVFSSGPTAPPRPALL